MRKLFVLGTAVVLAASTAYAAPNVVNNSQKGSLLIFADIDVSSPTRTTIVRLVNDGDSDVKVKCIYVDQGNLNVNLIRFKNWSDFVITLTSRQPVWFDAKTGFGSSGLGTANRFPAASPTQKGELICFAVTNTERNKRKFNHLAGTATVMDFGIVEAYEYTAHAFYARTLSATPEQLDLDGVEYDLCPRYLIGQFGPVNGPGVTLPGGQTFNVLENRLALASCVQEPRQDNVPTFTKLEFEVWNANEVKFTGAYRCVDSWWDTTLYRDAEMYNRDNFQYQVLGTNSAYYRVSGISSIRCNPLVTKAVGLIGIQSSRIELNGAPFAHTGSNTNHAGTMTGTIKWGLGSETEEGSVK